VLAVVLGETKGILVRRDGVRLTGGWGLQTLGGLATVVGRNKIYDRATSERLFGVQGAKDKKARSVGKVEGVGGEREGVLHARQREGVLHARQIEGFPAPANFFCFVETTPSSLLVWVCDPLTLWLWGFVFGKELRF
jgi:hypothetical protein